MFANILSRYWWMTLLRGVIWVLFGALIIAAPGISLVTLTLAFGVFALIDGIGNIVHAFGGRNENRTWWLLLLAGLAGIAVAVMTFLTPAITALFLLFYIAMWAIAIGVLEVVAAIRLRKEIEGEVWLALAGLVSIAFGVIAIMRPGTGVFSILALIAAYSIGTGLMFIFLAFRVRSWWNHMVWR
jgi:uncharacterized membrane protein HdeD (DUF308 family)